MRLIGQMSGTSLDGIDSVLVDIDDNQCQVLARHHQSFDAKLKQQILALCQAGDNELDRAARLSLTLSNLYANSVQAVLEQANLDASDIDAIGCHGQTVRHVPPHYSLQLINGAALAELTGIDVVCDFRSRDIAAKGQGAPLVPAFHHALFSSSQHDVAVINIGGMANISLLSKSGDVNGYDTGPGNVLLDAWCSVKRNQAYDKQGQWAASGEVIPDLLDTLLDDPYFTMAPPKSTGREHFNLDWLKPVLRPEYADHDVQATLLMLTVKSIAQEVKRHFNNGQVIVCGGGAFNLWLMRQLEGELANFDVSSSQGFNVDPQDIEAMAFAWLAMRCLQRKWGNVSKVTGALGQRVLGAIYPA